MGTSRRALQLTLAIFKPDISSHPHLTYQLRELILKQGFYFVRSKDMFLPRTRVEDFYKEHKDRFFYNRLVSFMSSGPLSTHILAHENAITEWRKLMGPTKVFKTIYSDPDSIRGRFGLTDTRNATHGSDSDETARKEISFFFSEFNVDQWYDSQEQYFVKGSVVFDPKKGIHISQTSIDQMQVAPNKTGDSLIHAQ